MRPRSRQQGIALLLVVGVLVMGGTLLTLSALNASTWRADRYRVSQEALLAAKEALVARAVADDDRPGSLPCPDTDDDGNAELFAGNACPSYLGRLPWRTLHLPDLRDGSGERLWYVLSASHRDDTSAQPINSDTAGEITLAGLQPASNALAVVFAPGGALMRSGAAVVQVRGCTVGTNCNAALVCTTSPHRLTPKCNPFNYLDVSGTEDNADRDTASSTSFATAAETLQFNDLALPILADDIMPLVERRVGREIAQRLREHYDAWDTATGAGFYPWPAPFNPAGSPTGVSGTAEGSLPTSPTAAVWSSWSANCTPNAGATELSCLGIFLPLFGLVTFDASGTVSDIGGRVFEAPSAANTSVDLGLLLLGGATPSWSLNRTAQQLSFTFSATNTLSAGVAVIRVRAPAVNAWVSSSWLTANQWDRVSYYALSPHYAINGSQSCGASCITVTNVSPGTGKQSVVVMTGRQLAAQAARPIADASQYLEAANYTSPADYAFARGMRSQTFNDEVAVVRP